MFAKLDSYANSGWGTWILIAYGGGYCSRRHQASALKVRGLPQAMHHVPAKRCSLTFWRTRPNCCRSMIATSV
ncbi:hypothetical protein MES5069_550144 [Mesorhizobium escarrei]|uniref:Uncharacterized protein n=1 Tax=Mesorhizobium escarrei TaxID=666018 RepID=A0ABM9ECT6_9HYPH|nr:hypothetical protein MES5069_550144 [Mesorhizobium escarrei]